jgi:hypothetical protein
VTLKKNIISPPAEIVRKNPDLCLTMFFFAATHLPVNASKKALSDENI